MKITGTDISIVVAILIMGFAMSFSPTLFPNKNARTSIVYEECRTEWKHLEAVNLQQGLNSLNDKKIKMITVAVRQGIYNIYDVIYQEEVCEEREFKG